MAERRVGPWLLLSAAWWLASPAIAQRPDAHWRTRETEHFRIHYPAPAEAWVAHLASRLDDVRARVVTEVGHAPESTIDVVVADPIARANGSAYPILGMPRLVLWTTPPGPDSVIGHYRDWGTLLAIHEVGHIAHLDRPSRNPMVRLSQLLVPAGPLARKAPRWLTEGYATWLEGELTGVGRPHSDLRAAILRRWAQGGTLPDYGRLSTDGEAWLGMSMAYLVGSAYLEWLVARTGPDALRHLWARMSARANRSFDAAFRGVFGDSPSRLYNRFRAELTHEALTLEAERGTALLRGEPWLATAWTTGAPVVSPDGSQLALVRRVRDRPSRLEIIATRDADDESAGRREAAKTRLLALDPEDVASVKTGPPPRRAQFVLRTRDGAEPYNPRWLGDDALLFVRFELGPDAVRRPDLFRWTPSQGSVERLTRGAGVREPDPAPDGRWAAAVRHRWGATQLVRVTLDGVGIVEPITEARVDTIYAHPRVAPDGERVAYVVHRGDGWRLEVLHLDDGRVDSIATTATSMVAQPAWGTGGEELVATVGVGGYLEVHTFDLNAGRSWPAVRTHGAALAPAPMPDGSALFYLALEPSGLVLHRRETGDTVLHPRGKGRRAENPSATVRDLLTNPLSKPSAAAASPSPAPRSPPPRSPPPSTDETTTALQPSKPYGFGPQEWLPLLSGALAPGASFVEAGVRMGDLVGRLDLVALGMTGETAEGAAIGVAFRGWPVALEARLSTIRHAPSRQRRAVGERIVPFDLDRAGFELAGRWQRATRTDHTDIAVGGFAGTVDGATGRHGQTIGFVRVRYERHQRRGRWRLTEALEGGLDQGRTGEDQWRRQALALGLDVARGSFGFGLSWRRHEAEGATSASDRLQVGGLAPSLRPEALTLGWIEVPGLPAGTLVGDRYEAQRLELGRLDGPLRLFLARHLLRGPGGQGWLRLVGIELSGSRAAWPLVRLPALGWTVGAAAILDPPFEDAIEGWVRLRWRP